MKPIEKRNLNMALTNVEAIENEGKKFITGIIPYNSKSQRMCLGYSACEYEMLSPTVFNKTLADDAEVYANYSHDDLAILGNTKSRTLTLVNTDNGLICKCEVPSSDIGTRAWETINRGDCRNLSFEFIPYEWKEEDDTAILTSAKLTAVSFCVINPAYKETDSFASIRSLCKRNNVDIEQIEKVISENNTVNENQIDNLKKLITTLQDILPKEEPAAEQEQPVIDTPVENTDPEKVKQLEELEKQLELEIGE